MDKEEILLKEYETCQSDNNALGNQSWISFSIIITANLVLLGQVIPSLASVSRRSNVYALGLIIFGLAMIYILLLFRRWDDRVSFHIRLNHVRMREIEMEIMAEQGYWLVEKKWSERSLDIDYDKKEKGEERIPESFKPILTKLKGYYPVRGKPKGQKFQTWYGPTVTKGFWNFQNIFCVLIVLWGLIALYSLWITLWKVVDC